MSTKGDTDPKPNPTPNKPQANANKQKSGNAILGFFVFLTFFIAVGGIGAGYYVWQQLQKDLQASEVERSALKHELSTLDENPRIQKFSHSFNKKLNNATSDVKKLDKNLEQLASEQKRIASVIQDTSDIVSRGQRDWMLKEVDHVLRMSQHRLLLDRDFEGALAGLKAADNRIKDINDVRLIPLRKSIAKQTQKLNQFPHPDYVGLQLELDNTIAELKSGLLKNAVEVAKQDNQENPSNKNSAAEDETEKPFDAKKLFAMSKEFFQDSIEKAKATMSESVNITRGEQKIALFIEEQEKKRAYDFLRNKLLAAKYSVSTRDDHAFHQQLNAAKAWLENSDEFSNQSILIKKIDTLNKSDLTPSLPNISEPTDILTKYMDSFKDKQ